MSLHRVDAEELNQDLRANEIFEYPTSEKSYFIILSIFKMDHSTTDKNMPSAPKVIIKSNNIKINNLDIDNEITLSAGGVDIIMFERSLHFINNGYSINIDLIATPLAHQIANGMPDYFNNPTDSPSWKIYSFENFINALKNKKGCNEAQFWYDSFDEVINSIKILEK